MSSETGGKATSTLPLGASGKSTVSGTAPGGTPTPCVVATCAGAWITPIVGGVDEDGDVGGRSSSDLEKPYPTNTAATMTPTVTAIRVVRDRGFGSGSIGSTTSTTLSR
jgi:hypothetical protein